ncbi:hypothetical protein QT970_18360, partial [Microcoleus sp. herbarium8]|uniref:hypothetical protein n=1 Tax=Microcoleus sp. herbarium8 TaxID=3055436 RepID=UPI002FD665E6
QWWLHHSRRKARIPDATPRNCACFGYLLIKCDRPSTPKARSPINPKSAIAHTKETGFFTNSTRENP